MRSPRAPRLSPILTLCVALATSGCLFSRAIRQDVYHEGKVDVFLRANMHFGSVVAKGYSHPATISAARLTHILSRLDIRKSVAEGNRRVPAIPTELLAPVAAGVVRALQRASEDQEVVVMAVRTERTLHILDQDYLTSFVAYVRGDQLFVHLSRSDWPVPDRGKNNLLPQPRVGENPMKMRVYPGTAMTLIDTHSVAVSWRDPIFARATRTRILPTGEVKRKTILLESPAESVPEEVPEEPSPETVRYPSGLTPDQLRELADLEEQRIAGEITEAEYRERLKEILGP